MSPRRTEPQALSALFLRFLKFGVLAWGGPVAQIAMIKRELVEGRTLDFPQRFNRLLAAYQVLPGPEAHELCVHLGMTQRGRIGGLLAGLGFMLPGLVLILALAWGYDRLDLRHPIVAAALIGLQISVIALIVRAVHRIGEHVLATPGLWLIAALSAVATWLGASFWIVLPAAGLGYATWRERPLLAAGIAMSAVAVATVVSGSGQTDAAQNATSASIAALFVSGLKAGLLTFGGAYTAIPFVRNDAVGRGWVSDGQFLDSLALSGVIPAPLIIFATFVGYLAAGLGGALAITAGIFLPAFAMTLIFFDRIERVIDDPRLHRFLEGVAAGVVGMIVVTAAQVAANLAADLPSLPWAAAIFAGSLALLYLWKSRLAIPLVIAAAGLAGMLAFA